MKKLVLEAVGTTTSKTETIGRKIPRANYTAKANANGAETVITATI